jgi:hypothetical protein
LKSFFVKFPAGHVKILDCKHIMDALYEAEELWPGEWDYVYDPYRYDDRIIRNDYFRTVNLSKMRKFLCPFISVQTSQTMP